MSLLSSRFAPIPAIQQDGGHEHVSAAFNAAPSSGTAELPRTSTERGDNNTKDARVVVLLDGEHVELNSTRGSLASLNLHHAVLNYVVRREGNATQAYVVYFGDRTQLETRMGSEAARMFIKGFNTTSDFTSAFVDAGCQPGAATEALCNHMQFLAGSCDYLILGGISNSALKSNEKLFSALKSAAEQQRPPKIVFLSSDESNGNRATAVNGREVTNSQPPQEPTSSMTVWPLTPPIPAPRTSARPSPESSTSNPHRPQTSFDFQPLLAVLREQKGLGRARPLRSLVGSLVSQSSKGRSALKAHGGFREYAFQAKRTGLVDLGEGKVLGQEWMGLR